MLLPACMGMTRPSAIEPIGATGIAVDGPGAVDTALLAPMGYFATATVHGHSVELQLAVDPLRTDGAVVALPTLGGLRSMLAHVSQGATSGAPTH